MSTNISYYEKIKELQTVQHEKEQNRLDLERQLNTHLRSDHRLAKLKAVRLQNYWKKLCEDEKRSLQRNEQLERDFERVEAHLARMAEKTSKLEKMKREYENYVERTYPNWKQIVMNQAQQASYEAQRQEYSGLQDPVPSYQQQQNIPSFNQQQPSYHQQEPSYQPQQQQQQPSYHQQQQSSYHQQQQQQASPQQQQTQTAPLAYPMKTTADSATSHERLPGTERSIGTSHQHLQVPGGAARMVDGSTSHQQIPGHERAQQYPSQQQLVQQQQQQQQQVPQQQQQPWQQQQQQKRSSQASIQASIHRTSTPQLVHDLDQTDDLSDLSEDEPLTPQDLEPAPLSKASVQKASPLVRSSDHIGQGEQTKRPCDLVPKPDMTTEGMINLLNALEGDMGNADSVQFMYRSEPPPGSVFRDIVNHGNRGAGLRHVNPESISMVILEQLPLLLAHTSSIGCMMPDSLLTQSGLPSSAQDLKVHMPRENHVLFDTLYDHFIKLLSHEVLTTSQIADKFSPALIAPQSNMETQCHKVLKHLLDNVDPALLVTSARSTSTFSTLPSARTKPLSKQSSPTKQPSLTKQPSATSQSSLGKQPSATSPQAKDPVSSDHEENDQNEELDQGEDSAQIEEADRSKEKSPSPEPSPQKAADSKKEESDDDSFFSQPVPKPESAINLTQSAAYQQMLSGSLRGPAYQDSDDSNDDIENQLGISSPVGTGSAHFGSGGAKSPEPAVVVSPSPTPRAADLSDSDDTPSFNDRKGTANSSCKPAETTAPPHKSEPQQNTSLLGSLGSTGKSSKKPAFLGDSDSDVDLEVAGQSTKTSIKFGDEEDDFDFYG